MSLSALAAYGSSSEDDEIPSSNQKLITKTKVKIMAPKLVSNNSDDEEPPVKKANIPVKPSNGSSSGLFAKLPAVSRTFATKNSSKQGFIPHVLTKKPIKKDLKLKANNKTISSETSASKDDLTDDEDKVVPFFSLIKKDVEEESKKKFGDESNFNQTHSQTSDSSSKVADTAPLYTVPLHPPKINDVPVHYRTNHDYNLINQPEIYQSFSANTSNVQNAEKKIHESSSDWIDPKKITGFPERKKVKDKIEFIDFNANDALEGYQEILLKSLSEEKDRVPDSKKKFTARQKQNGQLSYLIHQAQANEIKLRNAWAEGKQKRDAARRRYGF